MAKAGMLRVVTLVTSCAFSALYLAFYGKIVWRNRRNRFLFFGWLIVLVVFILIDLVVYAQYIRFWK